MESVLDYMTDDIISCTSADEVRECFNNWEAFSERLKERIFKALHEHDADHEDEVPGDPDE